MDELERRLRGLVDVDESRPAVEVLEGRVRVRRRRRRVAWAAGASAAVVAIVVVGVGLVSGRGTPRVEVAPIAPDPSDAEEKPTDDDPRGLVPPTSTEGDHTVAPLVFPDGPSGEIVYRSDLGLAELGVRPELRLWIETDPAASARTARVLSTFRGDVDEVLTELNGGEEPSARGDYGRAVRYELRAAQELRDVLAYQSEDWTLLVPVRSPFASREAMTEEDLHEWGELLHAEETADGYLVLRPREPLRITGGYSGVLTFGDDKRRVTVYANACTAGNDDAEPWRREDGTVAIQWCEPDAQVSVEVSGSAEFVDAARDGIVVRGMEGVVDDSWVTAEQMEAWQAETGRTGTWIVGYFFPGDFDYVSFEPDVLVDRWRRLSDDDLGMSAGELARAAYEALGGRPPRGVLHSLAGIDLDLRSATVDGARVTLDFGPGIEFATSGTTGASAMAMQVDAIAAHYFPEAEEVCILVEGEEKALFHDFIVCPAPLTR